ARSFIWPAAQVFAGLAAMGLLGLRRRRIRFVTGTTVAGALLACETAFLLSAGTALFSSSPAYLTRTPAEVQLERAVGSSLVGLGSDECFTSQLGLVPDLNVALGVRELAMYDPLFPRSYYKAWRSSTGQAPAPPPSPGKPFSIYCPAITGASQARLYGVGFVLEPGGTAGPAGTAFVTRIGDEGLFRVPGAALATLSAPGRGGGYPPAGAPGTPVRVSRPGPASFGLTTDATGPTVLRLRITDVPGWHATIDGKPLHLRPFDRVMLQARVPPGRHVIDLHYWPDSFSVGLVLALCAAVGLLAASVASVAAGRRRRARERSPV
ncbi:MAG: YfhO family protein, partial [Acidimicrobiales bacterium]